MSGKPITLTIKVRPNGRTQSLEELPDGTWRAQLRSPPVDGRANEELIALLAERFGVRKRAVVVKSGASGRTKLVRIESGTE